MPETCPICLRVHQIPLEWIEVNNELFRRWLEMDDLREKYGDGMVSYENPVDLADLITPEVKAHA